MLVKRNENTAELVGLSFGDGSLTRRKNSKRMKFQLRGDLREEKESYDKHIAPLFNKEIMMPLFNRKVGFAYNIKKNIYGIGVESVKIEKVLNYLGIPSGIKKELFIPLWIKNKEKYIKRFLRGLFDTDGCVYCQRNYSIKQNKYHTQIRLYLASTSKNLINEIFNLLNSLDFKCRIHKREKHTDLRGFNCQALYILRIDGGIQTEKWFREIGSQSQKHTTKYRVWKKFGFCPPKTSLEYRKKMLKNELDPYIYYAGVPKWSNGQG